MGHIVLHCIVLYYIGDLIVLVAVAALVGAAGFLLPHEEVNKTLPVAAIAVIGTFITCAVIFAFVIGILAIQFLCKRYILTKTQRRALEARARKDESAYMAFSQYLDDEDGTFGAEEEEVELAGIVSAPLPDLSAADLVTFEPGAGSGDPFSLVLPSLHPSRATAQTAFGIFQRRLRSPAREHYEAQQAEQPTGSSPIGSVPLMMHVVSGALITWTANVKQHLPRVLEFAGRFIAEWVRALLADVAVTKRLAELVERLERVFFGVYQASVVHLRRRTKCTSSGSVDIMRWYYLLCYKFDPDHYYWGVALLIQLFLFCFVPMIAHNKYVQVVLLQYKLLSFICLQCFFWPYRTLIHNFADLIASYCIALYCNCRRLGV